jgi:glycosyltransferase involved in cell wall biosynthesis
MKLTYIWGAGYYGTLTALGLEQKGTKLKGFIDKNAKQIKIRLELPVLDPSEVLFDKNKNWRIIIAVNNEQAIKEIMEILLSAGLKENMDFEVSSLIMQSSKVQQKLKPIQVDAINVNGLTSYDVDKKEVKNPLARVYLLTYNHAKFIKHCLNGILMQKTDFPFEIYIYDDCSTDGTSDIVREYAQKYRNIIVDVQPENYYSKDNKLWQKKITLSMKHHNCKYTAFVEGDDYWIDPYKLQFQVSFLETHSDFSVSSGGFIISNSNGEQRVNLAAIEKYTAIEIPDFEAAHFSPIGHLRKYLTRVYRTEAIPKGDEYYGDVMEIYYALKKGKGCYFSRIFGIYNMHSNGLWAGLTSEEEVQHLYESFKKFYCDTKDDVMKKGFIISALRLLNALKNKKQNICKDIINCLFPELEEKRKIIAVNELSNLN